MTTTKYWILGSALSLAALTACSSTSTRTDSASVNTNPTDYSSTADANAGKNAMVKGANPDRNPADDTVERRNANHYTSRWNRPAPVAKVEAAPAPAATETVNTTSSSADLGASSSGMGR